MTPEIFNLAVVFYAYFLWLYKEVAPRPARDSRWTRFLFGAGQRHPGGSARRHGDLLQAALHRPDRADRRVATVEAALRPRHGSPARLLHRHRRPGRDKRRDLRRVELPGRQPQGLLLPEHRVHDAGDDLRHRRVLQDDQRDSRGGVREAGTRRALRAHHRVLLGRPALRPRAVLLPRCPGAASVARAMARHSPVAGARLRSRVRLGGGHRRMDAVHVVGRRRAARKPLLHGRLPGAVLPDAAAAVVGGTRSSRGREARSSRRSWC